MAFFLEIKKWDVMALAGMEKMYYLEMGDNGERIGENSLVERYFLLSSSTGLCVPINDLKLGSWEGPSSKGIEGRSY